MKKSIIVLIISVLLPNIALAYNIKLTECEYTEEYKEWLNLPAEERVNIMPPEKCAFSNIAPLIGDGEENLPSSFTLKDVEGVNYMNAVRHQSTSNACWAFVSADAIYSSYMYAKKEAAVQDVAYSPAHLEMIVTNEENKSPLDIIKFRRDLNQGGTYEMTAAYLLSLRGPIAEEDLPFDKYTEYIDLEHAPREGHPVTVDETKKEALNLDTVSNKKALLEVKDIAFYNNQETLINGGTVGGNCNPEVITLIKKTLKSDGPIATRMYLDSSNTSPYISADKKYYNYNERDYISNHGVMIIGWDDSITPDKYNSMATPENNGAWLIKNSYGTTFGDEGYFYVSYEDNRICNMFTTFTNIDNEIPDNAYYYDYLGRSGNYTLNREGNDAATIEYYSKKHEIYLANLFTRKGTDTKEEIDHVTMYFTEVGIPYEIYYSSTGNLKSGVKIGEGVTTKPGYMSSEVKDDDGNAIIIDHNIESDESNKNYAIIYKLSFDDGLFDHPIALAAPVTTPQIEFYADYETTENVSFIYLEGSEGWMSFATEAVSMNLPIRLYTNNTDTGEAIGVSKEHELIPTITSTGSADDGKGTGKDTLEIIGDTTHELEDVPKSSGEEEAAKNLNYDTTDNPDTGAILSIVFLSISIISLVVVNYYQRKKTIKYKI